MEILDSLFLGFSVALRPDVLLYAFIGCLVGTLVGMLPGIGPLAGVSILLPLTFGLDPTKAIVMLAGIYYGSQYGGSTTSGCSTCRVRSPAAFSRTFWPTSAPK